MAADDRGLRHVPLGPGLVVLRLGVDPGTMVCLRGLLAGFDGLASPHADGPDVLALVTTEALEAELCAWLDELAHELPFTRLDRRGFPPAP